MNLLPIVALELRKASTRSGTYWSRIWISLPAIAVLAWVIVVARFMPAGPFGISAVFSILQFVAFIYFLFAGARLTSDCISQEKREGTLGFLFLTPLRGHDVILGKMFSKGILPTYTIMSLVPMVWFLTLLGGISGLELLCTVIALANVFFFSLAAGITASTFFKDRRRCELVSAALIIVLFFILFPVADALIHQTLNGYTNGFPRFDSPFALFANRVKTLSSPSFVGVSSIQTALISNAVIHAGTWCLIALSSWRVGNCWQERPPEGVKLSLKNRWRQWTYGSGRVRAIRRRAALDANPYYWRATRNRLRPLIPRMFITITLGAPLLIAISIGFTQITFYVFLGSTVLFWYLAPKFWIAREAARTISEERSDGTLEMLLSTPLSIRAIIRGQWMGLTKCYAAAVVFPILVTVILILAIMLSTEDGWLKGIPYAIPVLIAGTLMFVADCVALRWVGMWEGLKKGNAKVASISAFSRIVTLPTALIIICNVALAFLRSNGGQLHTAPYVVIGLWLFIGLTIDFFFIKTSRNLLYSEFRNIAQEPLGTANSAGAWGRALGRWYGRKLVMKSGRNPIRNETRTKTP